VIELLAGAATSDAQKVLTRGGRVPPGHRYDLTVEWTGNPGDGTTTYRSYGRNHRVQAKGRPVLEGSADPAFLGDAGRWNPEQLLVASLSQCHMLWYLHLAVEAGICVTSYVDRPIGLMAENADGSGQFTEVVLRPEVTVTDENRLREASLLHDRVGEKCFVSRSVNFPIRHKHVTQTPEVLSA
jgi:organic hydroperoxide reductase OsmC/OhrA